MNVIDFLKERGLIEAETSQELREVCQKPIKLYIGFDPTADSLHLGSLVGIIILKWFQKFGHTPVIVLGGATGRIGDPSGKSTERPLLSTEQIEHNISNIRRHFETILDFENEKTKPTIVNNDSWFASYSFIDFLRDVGKHFRVNSMLTKESVKNRLTSEEGISFTEFSYQLLQAYDFYHLFSQGVVLQAGGSDQWGNITAGIELTRKIKGDTVYGFTFPLLTRSDGKKFGKTEGGAVWLSADKTSPYELYQYLYRMPDADVIRLMRMLTLMDMEEIRHWEKAMLSPNYIPNSAQKKLAEELTLLLHGKQGLYSALRATEAVSPGHTTQLSREVFEQMMKELPYVKLKPQEIIGKKFVDLAAITELTSSKADATRLIAQGGAYMNNERVEDAQRRIETSDLIEDHFILLAAGKKKKVLVYIE